MRKVKKKLKNVEKQFKNIKKIEEKKIEFICRFREVICGFREVIWMGVLAVFEYFSEFCPKKRREPGFPTMEEGAFAETKPQNHKHKKHRKE